MEADVNGECECPLYREERGSLSGHEMTANRHPRNYILEIAYCAHPTISPWSRTAAMKQTGYLRLKCGGKFNQCPLTEEERGC